MKAHKEPSDEELAQMLLKKLRRLEPNMSCPNCGSPAQAGIGFGNVCVKFKTFVCDLCKTSHQAVSHRVKSISMSTWTVEEVNELTSERNGGNDAARHHWLGNAPSIGGKYPGGSRPKAGDRIEIFKQFVIDCYEHGNFINNEPYHPSDGALTPPISGHSAASSSTRANTTNNNATAARTSTRIVSGNHSNNNSNNNNSSNSPERSHPTEGGGDSSNLPSLCPP